MASGAQTIVGLLERAGVEVCFGLPGVHNLRLWEALRQSPIRLVGVRHEQAAAYAADGYARASGRLGVALTTTGPGAANAVAAAGEAWAARQPVLVIATDVPTSVRRPGVWRGALHEATDQAAMFAPVVKEVVRVGRAEELRAGVFHAGRVASNPPARPAYVEIPTDLLTAEVDEAAPGPAPVARPPAPDGERIARAARLIEPSRRPLIWAGGGAAPPAPPRGDQRRRRGRRQELPARPDDRGRCGRCAPLALRAARAARRPRFPRAPPARARLRRAQPPPRRAARPGRDARGGGPCAPGGRGRRLRHVHPGLLARRLPLPGGAAQALLPPRLGHPGLRVPAGTRCGAGRRRAGDQRLRRRRLPLRLRRAGDRRAGGHPANSGGRGRRRLRDAALRPGPPWRPPPGRRSPLPRLHRAGRVVRRALVRRGRSGGELRRRPRAPRPRAGTLADRRSGRAPAPAERLASLVPSPRVERAPPRGALLCVALGSTLRRARVEHV